MKIKVSKYVADQICGTNKKDFRIEYFCASGPGGQHRNKVATACRMTHKETGISAESSDSRSQDVNRREAFKKVVFKLIEYFKKQQPQEERRVTAGWGDKIRTYHEPRNTVKDHRTKVIKGYQETLDGDLDEFIEAMLLKDVE